MTWNGRSAWPAQCRGRGDWHRASATAIRPIREAHDSGTVGEQIGDHALDAAKAEGITGWDYEVIDSLLDIGESIQLGDDPDDLWYINGRYRGDAMFEQGVRYTLLARYEFLAPAPGRPLRE